MWYNLQWKIREYWKYKVLRIKFNRDCIIVKPIIKYRNNNRGKWYRWHWEIWRLFIQWSQWITTQQRIIILNNEFYNLNELR